MATASSSWMPAAGRHNVSIGSSLSKALKARKGQPPTQRNKALPERDFYALRYNHKPASIDPTKPGTLEVNPGKEVTSVRVERPTVNNNEVIVFEGDEKPAKEWECVLIYDEATQTFTLEKLDSLVNLNYGVKAPPRTRTATSPPSLSSSAAQTPRRSPARTAVDELEAQLEGSSTGLGTGTDANGKPDQGSFSLVREEEEEEGEELVVNGGAVVAPSPTPIPRQARTSSAQQKAPPPPPPQSQSQSSQQQPTQPNKARPTASKKSAPAPTPTSQSTKAARVSATPAAASTPTASSSSSSSKQRPKPAPSSTLTSARRGALEEFEIRGPIAPLTTSTTTSATTSASSTRRGSTATATPAQSQGSTFSLALPTVSGPDPLAHQGLYNNNNSNSYHGGTAAAGGAAASVSGGMESEDEWDEILAQPDRPTSSANHLNQQQQQQQEALTITIEEEGDDGLDDFLERELLGEDEPMADGDGDGDEDEDEDFEEAIIGGYGPSSVPASGPVSMNRFAGGDAMVEDEDDDFSSSEESEED